MDLELALSSPGLAFKQLIAKWRLLPATGAAPRRALPPRAPQGAEDRLGPVGIAQLVADYQAGISTTQLMRLYDLGKGSVLRLLEANGVPRRRQGLTPTQVEEAARLFRLGWSLSRIGRRFGKDHGVVSRALIQAGVRPTSS